MIKSIAKTLIFQIQKATQGEMFYLGQFIQNTDILNGHDAIIQAWDQRLGEVGLSKNITLKEVKAYLLSQKKQHGRDSKEMDGDLDDLQEITRCLDSLLKERETGLGGWHALLAENMFAMQKLIANIVG